MTDRCPMRKADPALRETGFSTTAGGGDPSYRMTIGPTTPNGNPSRTFGSMQTIACLPGDIVVTTLPELLAGMTSLPRYDTSLSPEKKCNGFPSSACRRPRSIAASNAWRVYPSTLVRVEHRTLLDGVDEFEEHDPRLDQIGRDLHRTRRPVERHGADRLRGLRGRRRVHHRGLADGRSDVASTARPGVACGTDESDRQHHGVVLRSSVFPCPTPPSGVRDTGSA